MCNVDWHLVLEFLKVLAAPLAAVAIAGLGLRSYRAQKRFDRRSEWYQHLHGQLGKTADLFRWAGAAHAAGQPDRAKKRMDEALAASLALSERMSEGFLFGLKSDLVALRRVGLEFERIHREIEMESHISDDLGTRAADACLSAANEVAAGYRKELGLPSVDLAAIDRQVRK